MNYGIAKLNAQLFANERNISVYIAKSYLTEDYCLLFDKEQKPTPRFQIVETVTPCIIHKSQDEIYKKCMMCKHSYFSETEADELHCKLQMCKFEKG